MVTQSSSEPIRRLGVFGGTFDPIHCAHLAMARAAMEFARLDQVLFVVSAHPPHKKDGTSATPEQRYDMVRIALVQEPHMEPCRLELDRPGLSYTVDTLAKIREKYPAAELFLILGMDSLVDFEKWRKPEEILRLARILAIPRLGYVPPEKVLHHTYDIVPFPETSLSSTEVRRRIARGEDVSAVIPPGVLNYIRQNAIYKNHD